MKQKGNNNEINQAIRYSPIIKHILEYKPKKILEIGCGSQGIGRFLNINFDGLDLTSSDYDDNELKTYEGMHFIRGNALNMPLPDNLYDYVYSCDMLEHIHKKDREKSINEAIRVCKKGGYVMFGFPCGFVGKSFDYLFFYFLKLFKKFRKKTGIPGWLQEHIEIKYPTEREIRKIIDKLKEKYIISSYYSDNIFRWGTIMFIDAKLHNLKNKIIDIYIHNPRTSKSILPYRKWLIIQK